MTVSIVNGGLSLLFQELIPAISVTSTELTPATSSILAATLLGTLSELCGLHWSEQDLFRRTMALEQLLTTGGGWTDFIFQLYNQTLRGFFADTWALRQQRYITMQDGLTENRKSQTADNI